VTFLQSTLEEITESERQMLLAAKDRYGNHYVNARASSVFLSKCIVAIDHDRLNFGRFLAIMKKHHMLSIMSAVRLHKVQAMMNLRQVLEAGAAAAFAIANPEDHYFFKIDDKGIVKTPPKLTDKRYDWLEKNFKEKSDSIKAKKSLINNSQSHANVVSAHSVFQINDTGELINAPFFDIEDNYFVKSDLWLASAVALEIMELFYEVNIERNVIEFMPGFPEFIRRLESDTNARLAELKGADRYQRTMARQAADNAD
jgi:hypothetical protein